MIRHVKVNLSLDKEVDAYLNKVKAETGFAKSQVLSMLVSRYGKRLAKDLHEYARKEETLKNSVSSYAE